MAELAALGHDVDTVRLEQLAGRDDGDVWSATQAAGRFLVTQDLDFSDRRTAPRMNSPAMNGHVSAVLGG